jgi:hypothetical protein
VGFPDGEEDERHEARPVFFFFKVEGQAREHAAGELERSPESLRPIRLKVSGFFFVSLSGKKTKKEKKG